MRWREEAPSSPASRRLWDEYLALVRERLGPSFVPSPDIFATDEDLAGPGAVWLVGYEGDAPVACGGLRPLDPGVAELKRMYVTAAARGRGHGRRLLEELERRAAQAGTRRIRAHTTEALVEAIGLYVSAGYREVEAREVDGRRYRWLERDLSGPAARPGTGSGARRPA